MQARLAAVVGARLEAHGLALRGKIRPSDINVSSVFSQTIEI